MQSKEEQRTLPGVCQGGGHTSVAAAQAAPPTCKSAPGRAASAAAPGCWCGRATVRASGVTEPQEPYSHLSRVKGVSGSAVWVNGAWAQARAVGVRGTKALGHPAVPLPAAQTPAATRRPTLSMALAPSTPPTRTTLALYCRTAHGSSDPSRTAVPSHLSQPRARRVPF
jgi:hypothetical protein